MSARDMVWRRLLVSSLAVAAALGIAACGKGSGGDQAAASDQRFPGYQQVGGSGDAAQLWFNPTDITRDSGAYLIHALKSFPDGYARFDVATNCRDLTRRMPGAQYRADGTADKDYPGNDAAVPAKSEPGMAELMSKACGVAMAARSIRGEFKVPAALELLYGAYDAQSKSASWQDAEIPAGLPGSDMLQWSAGRALQVTGVANFAFSEGGQRKQVLVTNAIPDGGGCHACTGLLGVTIFKQDGDAWKVEASYPYLASMGASGSVGQGFEWTAAGGDQYALIVTGGDMHQGYETASSSVFLRGKNGGFTRVVEDAQTGSSDAERLSVKTRFVKGKDSVHDDIQLAFTHELAGQAARVAEHRYAYSDGKYELVKQDDAPAVAATGEAANKAVEPGEPSRKDTAKQAAATPKPKPARVAAAPAPVPAPQAANGPSFDCGKARSDAERLICADGDLAAQDAAVARLLGQARAAVADRDGFRDRVRQQWGYRDSACHDRQCLTRWYAAQRAYLAQVAQTGQLD